MTAITFDTLKFVEILKKSGIPENQAKAISKAFAYAHNDAKLATKTDLKHLEYRLIIKLGTMMTVLAGLIVTLGKIL